MQVIELFEIIQKSLEFIFYIISYVFKKFSKKPLWIYKDGTSKLLKTKILRENPETIC